MLSRAVSESMREAKSLRESLSSFQPPFDSLSDLHVYLYSYEYKTENMLQTPSKIRFYVYTNVKRLKLGSAFTELDNL